MKKQKKDKIYSLIGRAVVRLAGWILLESVTVGAIVYVVCNCCTTIR